MSRYNIFCSIISIAVLLLGGWSVVDAASKQSGQPSQRAIRTVPEAEFRGSSGERRVALVIGNAAYAESPLKNPVNDANDMAAALKHMGFEVIVLNNADLRKMKDATEEFSKQLRRSDVGLFFYAGHGMQVAGDNYLVPIGARLNREQDVPFEAYHVGRLLGVMEDAGNALNLIILDACRNNPFARSFRSAQRGLAVMQAASGSLIAYATAPGSVASDGEGRNGIYTRNLLRYMQTPGLSVEEMFKQVRINVRQETGQEQTPWESSSLTRSFSFAVSGGGAGPMPPTTTSSRPSPQPQEKEPVVAALAPQTPPQPPTQPALGLDRASADKSLVNSIQMEFVLIPPGEFTMGADGSNGLPPHKVMLSRSFYMGKYEVTQAQWAAVMGNNPSYFTGEQKASNVGKDIGNFFQKLGGGEEAKKDLKLDPNRPVERVSWNEVQDFIKRLNEREGQGKYRLPTEAEWEYAARAGSSTSAGNGPLEQYAWCAQNAASTTHAVGQLKPNAWGLYDMFGNVWEWVQDWWGQYQKEMVTDPQGPQAGSLKIFRGGAWNQPPAACQPAHRYYDGPTFKHLAIGFRLVREVQ